MFPERIQVKFYQFVSLDIAVVGYDNQSSRCMGWYGYCRQQHQEFSKYNCFHNLDGIF